MNNYYHQDSSMNEEGVEFVPNAWSSELPADILSLITDKVRSLPLSEFIRFGSVCLGWRSFSIENYQHLKLPNQAPVLLIPIPPSLLAADHHHHHHHHKKGILSPPPSSSLIEVEEQEEEEEEEEEEKEEEEKVEEEEEGEEKEIEKREEEEEEEEEEETETNDNENEKKEEDDDDEEEEEKEEEDDDDDDEEDLKEETFQWENFYSPREIWGGQDANQRHKNRRAFYSLSEKMVYRDFQLPVPYYKNVVGSSYGWLVAVEECYAADNGQLYLPVSLFNPFRTYNNEIQLPPMTQGNPGDLEDGETILDSYFLIKAFLSANPSSLSDPTTQLVVLGVYGRDRLAFCRPGDQSWTRLDVEEDYRPIQDIICYQDQFFAVLQNGYVFAFILDADDQLLATPIVVTQGFLPPPDVRVSRITYLVESGGDLLQVWRYLDWLTAEESERPNPVEGNNPVESDGYITNKFLVFKLDSTGDWVEMKTLNNRMLFIGTSSSMSLLASDFPGWSRPNSIYYTDDYCEAFVIRPYMGPHDIGIFNLDDGSFERHYEAESKTILPSPIWIQPML